MSLLECLIGLAISLILITPVIQSSGVMVAKQVQYQKTKNLSSEADRAFELIGRAIRMAGYQNWESAQNKAKKKIDPQWIEIHKGRGYNRSDAIIVRHEIAHAPSSGVDFDCLGNALSQDRTKNDLALQGFLLERQANIPKGIKVNGGSLICQSLDRHARVQNTTLMNGVNYFSIEEQGLDKTSTPSPSGPRLFKVQLEMTDGQTLHLVFERYFSTRNHP